MTREDPGSEAVAVLAAGRLRAPAPEAEQLIRAASPILERFIRIRLSSRRLPLRLVEDCGQNVLARVWQFRSSYRGESEAQFWRWIRQICDNERRRIQEREARRAMQPLTGEDPAEHATGERAPAPDRPVVEREELTALGECLAALDPKFRQIIDLAYFPPALPERAIATVLGCSPANVHKLKDQGLKLLEACLGRKGIR